MNENIPLYDLLSSADVFRHISEEDRAILAGMATLHHLEAGDFLSSQGDYWPELILIESGVLKWILLSERGKEHIFFTLEPSSIFWGHSFFDDLPMPASLVAKKTSKIYSWNREILKPIISRYPEAMWDIGKNLVGIMRRNREVVINLAFRQMTGRMAKILLDISDKDDEPIERDFTLDEIATMAATSQEVVCRILYEMQDQEILHITRAQIMINDRKSLQGFIEKD